MYFLHRGFVEIVREKDLAKGKLQHSAGKPPSKPPRAPTEEAPASRRSDREDAEQEPPSSVRPQEPESPEPKLRHDTDGDFFALRDSAQEVGYMTSATHALEDTTRLDCDSTGGVRKLADLFKQLEVDENRRVEEE